MIDLLFLSIFFLLFIQLFIGFIIVFISAYNKDRYYEYDEKIELYTSPFDFEPIYYKDTSKKLIEDGIEAYKLSIELKYIMAMFGIAMSIDYFFRLNLFEIYFTELILKMKDYIELPRSIIIVIIFAYIIIKGFIIFVSALKKYKLKREYFFA